MNVRYRLIVAGLSAAALVSSDPGTADACSAPPPPKPHELIERATAIVHVRVRGLCSEFAGACAELTKAPPTPPAPPPKTTTKPYAEGWPPIAAPPGPVSATEKYPGPEAHYQLLAVEVVEVLKGPPIAGRFAIRGELVTQDDYNDREPPYPYVRRGGRTGSCFAYTHRRDAEYLLFLRYRDNALTPYWSPHAPVNEQVGSTRDPWIAWVRGQLARK